MALPGMSLSSGVQGWIGDGALGWLDARKTVQVRSWAMWVQGRATCGRRPCAMLGAANRARFYFR